jgi:energy-coupling factor transporter ATP-binding protein EcfA2
MYFRNWPFRMVPERSPDVWADRKKLFEEMKTSFNDTLEKKRSTFLCVWGYVGAGKSHSLLHFKTMFEKEGKNSVVYSPLPKEMRRFADLYQQGFYSAMNSIVLAKVAADIWTKLNPSGVDLAEEMKALEIVTNEIACGRMDIATAILTLGRSVATSKSVRDPMCLLSQAWLSGERLSKRYLAALGVSANLTDDSDFVKAASSIIRMLTYQSDRCQEYCSLIWILDDCHYFAEVKKQSQKNFAAIQQGIRDLFDLCPDDLSLALSFASGSFSIMKELLIEDLQSRVSRVIQIPPLTLEESFEFISDLLSNEKFRSEKNVDDKYYPYTKESLKLTIQLISKQGDDLTPRNLMKYFDILTSRAQDEIYPNKITTEFAQARFPAITQA